jgi:hypothetical protein
MTAAQIRKARDEGWKKREQMESQVAKTLGNRNYTLFAVLADVRNDGIRPLFAGRGLPNDCSNTTKKEIPLDSDYHSHTYFTARELIDVDQNAVAQASGSVILYADQYQDWKETGKVPDDAEDYAYDFSPETREVTEEEMTMLLMANDVKVLAKKTKKGVFVRRGGPHVWIGTPLTYKQLVPELFRIIPDLQKLGDPEKIRVVIAFDN